MKPRFNDGEPVPHTDVVSPYTRRVSLCRTVFRGNVIREVNDVPDPSSFGMSLIKCENAVVEQNVIDPAVGTAIVQDQSGSLEYLANTTPAGVLLQGYDQQNSRKVDELTTRVEDSFVVSF